MNQEKRYGNESIEIDFRRLAGALLRRIWLIGAVTALCAVLSLGAAFLFVTPKYQSSVLFYASNSAIPTSGSMSSGDIAASKSLVDTFGAILGSRRTLADIIEQGGYPYSCEELEKMIETEAVGQTQLFRVVVTAEDPEQARQIAATLGEVLPRRIGEIVEGCSAKVVDQPYADPRPSSPEYGKILLISSVLGLLLSGGGVILMELLDTSVHSEEDIARVTDLPVLAAVSGDSGNAEAYRVLRTKLQFAFPGGQNCRVMAVTGPGTPAGKTGCAVNLADSLAQLGRKVLLVDCDMRTPQCAERLGFGKPKGLSNYLAGQCKLRELLRECSVTGETKFLVLPAGDLPPNPAELLSSAAMSGMIRAMGKVFDDIILDLPGLGEGSDAMAVSGLTQGYLLVVEHGTCSRAALERSLEQLESVKANVTGMIYIQHIEKRG